MKVERAFDAAIFDIGNVLLQFDFADAFRRFGHEGVELLRGQSRWMNLKINYESGLMERAAFVADAIEAMGFAGQPEDFMKVWQDIFTLNLPMWEVVEAFRHEMPIYLLSNTNDLHVEVFTRQAEGFSHFADAIYSHEVKLLKPDPAIFELAIKRFQVTPDRTLYIDDLPDNVAAARASGLLAIEYRLDRHEEFLRELERLGW